MPSTSQINISVPNSHKVKFFCTLTNGERIFEEEGPWQWDATGSPWHKVIDYTVIKNLDIVSLGLFVDEWVTDENGKKHRQRRTYNLHGKSNNPRLPQFAELEKPIDFEVGRTIVVTVQGAPDPDDEKSRFTVATAIYPNHKTQIWVSEYNPRHSWIVTIPG